MRNKQIDWLAKQNNLSKSTVSKALHHSHGVDWKTRKTVLDMAKTYGVVVDPGDTDIVAILPDNPKYFWKNAYNGMAETTVRARRKFSIFTSLSNADIVEDYLLDALDRNAKIIIIAVPENNKIQTLLREISAKTPIVLLCEPVDGICEENTYLVGSDAYDDGCLLASAYLERFGQFRDILCLQTKKSPNNLLRAQGFADTLKKAGHPFTFTNLLMPDRTKVFASQLARILSPRRGTFDCIYCCDGLLPQVALALQKLDLEKEVVCLGFENPPGSRPFIQSGTIVACLEQDMYAQGQIAMKIAGDYVENGSLPASKKIYLKSKLTVNNPV